MKELHHGGGAFHVEDRVAEALEHLAVALAENRMSATVTLRPSGEEDAIEFTLGMDRVNGRTHVLRARPASGEASHLGIEDL
jgi:hypothetical protein